MFNKLSLLAGALVLGSMAMASDKPAVQARLDMEGQTSQPSFNTSEAVSGITRAATARIDSPTISATLEQQPLNVDYRRDRDNNNVEAGTDAPESLPAISQPASTIAPAVDVSADRPQE